MQEVNFYDMKYKDCIEKYFLIDDSRSGELIEFKFRKVQQKYYDELVKNYDIERNGITNPVREIILKARKEGFTSLILALFAVDDLLTESPTETLILSYKDSATEQFRKRYRLFLTSYLARKQGISVETIKKNPSILNTFAKQYFSVDAVDIELKHNKAHFYCGTASARTGGRGGTVHKLLFSEAAFYPDKKEIRAREIIEGTANQMDKQAGWIFTESTANGSNNFYAQMWELAQSGQSRYKARFYGWQDFYTPEQFEIICSEFTDKRLIPQEFPKDSTEAFLTTGDRFFDPTISSNLVVEAPKQILTNWKYFRDFEPNHRYAGGADVSEGVGRHNSTIAIIDFDAKINIGGRLITKAKLIASYCSNKIAPDLFAHEIKNGGNRYGNCVMCPERNNHGFATLAILKDIYFNIWRDDNDKLGWQTNMATKPKMLHELRSAIHEDLLEISDEDLKREIINYPAQDLNTMNVDEEDETDGHYDRVIAVALAWAMRNRAVPSGSLTLDDISKYNDNEDKSNERFSPIYEI